MRYLAPLVTLVLLQQSACGIQPFRIEVVDAANGWPVPLVQLTTTSNVSFVTDNAGVVAFDLPEFMGRETWLTVFSHGYEVTADGFGNRGARFTPQPGGQLKIEIQRKQIAQRMGRLTGSGLLAESQKLGRFRNWVDSGITGSDSVQTADYKGKLYWIWGDTAVPGYPLGIFHAAGATTIRRPLSSIQPPLSIRYHYFQEDHGKPRGVAQMPGEGPTWVSGLVAVADQNGREHLVGTYAKVPAQLQASEIGLIEWNDQTERFDHVATLWNRSDDQPQPPQPYPDGHPLFWEDSSGQKWVYFNGPPNLRCPATFEAWQDRSQWQKVDNPKTYESVDGGEIEVASAAVAWSAYRQRWIMIIQQKFGTSSAFGEVWYVEGETPQGPWGPAVKVATHQNYTFYNVQIDWQLTSPQDPVLLFEGTYTQTFTDNQKTPRYDYNQVLYRLDLDDPALKPAQRN